MHPFQLRDARPDDSSAIAAIYQHYVRRTCITFEEVAPGPDEIASRMGKTRAASLPYYVAEGPNNTVIGYAYASPFHARPAYRYSIENSVYIAAERTRQGVGKALMQRLINECTTLGFRQMIALISVDKENPGSIDLHSRLGFKSVGTLAAVGWKFGRWIDVMEMQLMLGEGASSAPPSPGGR
jgi:L-amino acid N-acyltransferase YncA